MAAAVLAGSCGFLALPAGADAPRVPVLAQKDDEDLLLPIGKGKAPAPAKEDDGDLLLPIRKAPAGNGEAAGDDLLLPAKKAAGEAKVDPAAAWRGFVQGEAAYAFRDPQHWSKAKLIVELGRSGRLGAGIKWKVSGRAWYDGVFDIEDTFYPAEVRHDQRYRFQWRETYLDFAAGGLDWRIGRQHVVWGEMVTLFFADVVSARDLREFVLPDFDMLRIPQWAVRAEYFRDDFHAEAVWIPVPTLDEIGRRGAEFYAFPPATSPLLPPYGILTEEKPGHRIGNSNVGLRASMLAGGWDLAAFYYHSIDVQPTFYRMAGTNLFTARHGKIDQLGATLAKDLGEYVLKGEAVYTQGRRFNVTRALQPDGLVASDTLDWIVGADFTPFADGRFTVQLFQRYFTDHDPDMITDRSETGLTLLVSGKPHRDVELQGLLIHSLNRADWMFRPKLTWSVRKNWRWVFGLDLFKGPPTGLFGQYDLRDRIYTDLRYSF
ncbi:MAG: hypothetical protein Fur0039_07770 [Rhodocyclaceae bacterium]